MIAKRPTTSTPWGALLILGALACGRTGLGGDGPPGASSNDAAAASCTRGFGPARTFANKAQLDDAVATSLDIVVSFELAAPSHNGSDVGTGHLAFDGTISQAWHNLAFSHSGGITIIPSPMELALGPSGVVALMSYGQQCTAYLEATGSGTLSQHSCFVPLGTEDGFTALAPMPNGDVPLAVFDPVGKLTSVTPTLYTAAQGYRAVRARSNDGTFLVARGTDSLQYGDSPLDVMVQHFGPHGEVSGAATLVLSDPVFGMLPGHVALATTMAGAVAVWSSGNPLDTASSGVWMRALDHDGVPVAAASRVLGDSALVAATSIPSGALVVAAAGNRISAFVVSPDGALHGEVMSVDAAAQIGALHVVPTPAGALVLYAAADALWAVPLCVP